MKNWLGLAEEKYRQHDLWIEINYRLCVTQGINLFPSFQPILTGNEAIKPNRFVADISAVKGVNLERK